MNTLCILRDIYRSIRDLEESFQQKHDISLNEGMLLCSLKSGKLSSTELAEVLGLTPSNTSKVIRSLEIKELIDRSLGKTDKRQMYFSLNNAGLAKLKVIKEEEQEIRQLLIQIDETIRKIEQK